MILNNSQKLIAGVLALVLVAGMTSPAFAGVAPTHTITVNAITSPTNNNAPLFSGTVSPNPVGIGDLLILVSSDIDGVVEGEDALLDGTWNIDTSVSPLSEGTHSLTFELFGGTANSVVREITVDTTAPTITCPADTTVVLGNPTAPSSTGSATATDSLDNDPAITFSDVSGANQITRTWGAQDEAGNSATCDQDITIITLEQAVNDLIGLGDSHGANTSVLGNVTTLLNDDNPNNDKSTCGKLNAFINKVDADKKLTPEQKSELIDDANTIKASIGC